MRGACALLELSHTPPGSSLPAQACCLSCPQQTPPTWHTCVVEPSPEVVRMGAQVGISVTEALPIKPSCSSAWRLSVVECVLGNC